MDTNTAAPANRAALIERYREHLTTQSVQELLSDYSRQQRTFSENYGDADALLQMQMIQAEIERRIAA